MRKLGFDQARLDGKVIEENDQFLVMSAVIAREIVQEYSDGRAYKPADELEQAAWTADGRWVKTMQHPESGLLVKRGDIQGRLQNVRFAKDITDPKTRRPMIRGIRADVKWFKDKVDKAILDDVKTGKLTDVSIGFTYDEDRTPGEFNGEKYDYVQRNIFIDHLCAPTPAGRCPTPFCGIGVDTILKQTQVAGDPWEETENSIRSGHKSPDSFDPESMRTITITEGIKAVIGCPKGKFEKGHCTVGTEVQSFIFDKEKYTMEQAKGWFKEHEADTGDQIEELAKEADCLICKEIDELGKLGFAKRMVTVFGQDAFKVLTDQEEGEREKAKEAQRKRAAKYPIGIKEGGNITKPSEYEDVPEDQFADPVNFRYPMTEKFVQGAWSYINQRKNRAAGGYTEAEWTWMRNRVKKAMERHGHEVSEEEDSFEKILEDASRTLKLHEELKLLEQP